MRIAVFYAAYGNTFSYNDDWLDAFNQVNSEDFKVDSFNILNVSALKWFDTLINYDWLIFLHSTNSNSFAFSRLKKFSLAYSKTKKVFFVGNEYKLMPEKISFIKNTRMDIVASQLPQDTAEWLYDETTSKVISMPHALNQKVFRADLVDERKIDIGTRSAEYPWYLGDTDRNKMLTLIDELSQQSELVIDVSSDESKRFTRDEWAAFLASSKFTVATEAGSAYLERDDHTRKAVNNYVNKNPDASFDEVFSKFFKEYSNPVSGKCISPRHFDAIGTKTCQILLEGRYNDILVPGEHYVEVKKDFSNLSDVISIIKDKKMVNKMIDQAYDHVINNHTHGHRVQSLLKIMQGY